MSLLVLSSEFLLSNFCITLADEVRIARLGGKEVIIIEVINTPASSEAAHCVGPFY